MFEDIFFTISRNENIICGVCQVECSHLIVHMTGNEYCTQYFSDMEEFKKEYSKYRDKMSWGTKRKAEDNHGPKGDKKLGTEQGTEVLQKRKQHLVIKKTRMKHLQKHLQKPMLLNASNLVGSASKKMSMGRYNVECVKLNLSD